MRNQAKKKVFIDARLISASGIGRYIREILPIFYNREDTDLTLIGDEHLLLSYKQYSNVTIKHFKYGVYSLIGQLLLPFVVGRCDLFWSPHFSSTFLPVKSKKRITTIHDVFHIANKEYYSKSEYCYSKFLYKLAIRNSDKVIAVSNFTKNEIISYFNCKVKIEVIYNGIDNEGFRFKSNNIPDVLKHSQLSKYLLCVGNVKPHKNVKVVIQAFRELRKIDSEVSLIIVGKKEGFIKGDDNLIKDKVERVVFTGYIPDEQLIYLYQNADAFIFPSLYEGFGLPPLEGLAAGTRVIVSDRQPMKEVCKGYVEYFDPLDAKSLIDTITKAKRGNNLNLETFLASYSWDNSRKLHRELFNKLK